MPRFPGPSILTPYQGPVLEHGFEDIVIYLRPESNGIEVESTLLKVIYQNPDYKRKIHFAYLANIPGNFIVKNRIVEQHYASKLIFAHEGIKAFTPTMKSRFEKAFAIPADDAPIVGAFEALKILKIDHSKLFSIRVDEKDFAVIHEQTVKRYQDLFIVNYDLPALLHKNTYKTDIAVMIFRTSLEPPQFEKMFDEMGKALIDKEIVDKDKHIGRVFHYSQSPFEEILDCIGYLYDEKIKNVATSEISFFAYLLKKGIPEKVIMDAIANPIMTFRLPSEEIIEEHIFHYTRNSTYHAAYEKLLTSSAFRDQLTD